MPWATGHPRGRGRTPPSCRCRTLQLGWVALARWGGTDSHCLHHRHVEDLFQSLSNSGAVNEERAAVYGVLQQGGDG